MTFSSHVRLLLHELLGRNAFVYAVITAAQRPIKTSATASRSLAFTVPASLPLFVGNRHTTRPVFFCLPAY